MGYLITTRDGIPVITNLYDDGMFNAEVGMIVYDLYYKTYTTDGVNWNDIEEDYI